MDEQNHTVFPGHRENLNQLSEEEYKKEVGEWSAFWSDKPECGYTNPVEIDFMGLKGFVKYDNGCIGPRRKDKPKDENKPEVKRSWFNVFEDIFCFIFEAIFILLFWVGVIIFFVNASCGLFNCRR